MRDEIKQIMIEWNETNCLPNDCKVLSYSGGCTILNTTDSYANWKVTVHSIPWDKVTYKIYNSYYPNEISEQGVLKIS